MQIDVFLSSSYYPSSVSQPSVSFNFFSSSYIYYFQILNSSNLSQNQHEALRRPARCAGVQRRLRRSRRRVSPGWLLLLNLRRTRLTLPSAKTARDTSTCSLGIGRVAGSISWDITVYNVPQAARQDDHIVATAKNQIMDKGQSVTVNGITITNKDNAPVFDYDVQELRAPLSDPANGVTKVELDFVMGDTKWTTADCWAGNIIFSAGRESWSCDFPCGSSQVAREL